MDETLQSSEQSNSSASQNERFAFNQEIDIFFAKLAETGVRLLICSILPDYLKEYKSMILDIENVNSVASLYQSENLEFTYRELLGIANDICREITSSEIEIVEKETQNQAVCSTWFDFIAERVTASKLYAVCEKSVAKPSRSLI